MEYPKRAPIRWITIDTESPGPKKVYCFDIDGTLCSDTSGDYSQAQPYAERIAKVNALHAAGHSVKLFTARGSTTGVDWRELTESQLEAWGVSYDELLLGKPFYDIFIDDKAINSEIYF